MCYYVPVSMLQTVTTLTSLKLHSNSEKYILIPRSIDMGKIRCRQVKQFAHRYSLSQSQSQTLNLSLFNTKTYFFPHYPSGFQTMTHKT